jgi:large subunit ribosomal protein L30
MTVKKESAVKEIRVTLVRSIFGRLKNHRDCVHGLGLTRMHQTVQLKATPENMGMVHKVAFMLKVEEA